MSFLVEQVHSDVARYMYTSTVVISYKVSYKEMITGIKDVNRQDLAIMVHEVTAIGNTGLGVDSIYAWGDFVLG